MHVVETDQDNFVAAARQHQVVVDKHMNARIAQRLDHGGQIVISHDPDDAVARPHVFQDACHRLRGLAAIAGQPVPVVAGQNAQIRLYLRQQTGKCRFKIHRSVRVQVAHMQDGVSVEGRRQVFKRDIETVDLDVGGIAHAARPQAGNPQHQFQAAERNPEDRPDQFVFEHVLRHAPQPARRIGRGGAAGRNGTCHPASRYR